jgi:hypothetical protein
VETPGTAAEDGAAPRAALLSLVVNAVHPPTAHAQETAGAKARGGEAAVQANAVRRAVSHPAAPPQPTRARARPLN